MISSSDNYSFCVYQICHRARVLVAYNSTAKCHTFWRLMAPSGTRMNALTTEHLPYILAVKLYAEADGASAEVSPRSFTYSFLCNRDKSAPRVQSGPHALVALMNFIDLSCLFCRQPATSVCTVNDWIDQPHRLLCCLNLQHENCVRSVGVCAGQNQA